MIDQICIIGCGLIGSSMGLAIRKNKLAATVIMADHDRDVVRRAEALKLGDVHTASIEQAVEKADVVILAVPVGANAAVMQRIAGVLKPGCVVSDVGSVKEKVVADVTPFLPEGVQFVPAHPIAGTENSGPEAGFDSLFEGRWALLTPLPESDLKAVEVISLLWQGMGSMIATMDPHHHDSILAITSHLPHLIAYSIVDTAVKLGDDLQSEVIQYSAGGFRDFTRIAASNPTMWRDVFLNNKKAVLDILERYNRDLRMLEEAIRKDDGEMLFETFTRTRDIRRRIIDAKQLD